MSANSPGGPTGSAKAPPDAIWIVDAFPHFQPIRLPARAFYRSHLDLRESLQAFIAEHRRRFPHGPAHPSDRPRLDQGD